MIPTVWQKMSVIVVVVLFCIIPVSPTHADLTLDTSLSVSEQYIDNLFFTFANKEEDFATFVTPRFTLTFSNKHVRLGGTYAASGQFYVNNTAANTVAHGTNFDIDLPFLNRISKKLEVRVNESFNITPAQPGFSGNSSQFTGLGSGAAGAPGAGGGIPGAGGGIPGGGGAAAAGAGGAGVGGIGGIGGLSGNSLNNQGIFNARSTTSYQNRARIRIGYKFTPRFEGDVQYSNTIREFTSSLLQDSLAHAVRTTLTYNITGNTRINGGYSLRIIEFDGSGGGSNPQAPGGTGTNTNHSLELGAGHELRPSIPISGRVAVTVSDTEVGTTQLNFTGRAQISKIFPDGEISLRLNQRIGGGGGVAASTTLNQNAVITASKSITRYISAFGHFGYSRNRSLAGRAIETDTYQFRGGANMRILEWLSGGVTYSYINQESNGNFGNTAQSNQIFVGLTATPEPFTFFK